MDIEIIRNYCLNKKGTDEGFPFNEETIVFKVMGKIFLLTNIELTDSINLKCDPETAIDWRERYDAVKPGFHMNKTHWNTVELDGSIPDNKILEMIDHSYDMVVKGLKKTDKEKLAKL